MGNRPSMDIPPWPVTLPSLEPRHLLRRQAVAERKQGWAREIASRSAGVWGGTPVWVAAPFGLLPLYIHYLYSSNSGMARLERKSLSFSTSRGQIISTSLVSMMMLSCTPLIASSLSGLSE